MKLKISEPCHEDWSKMTPKQPKIGMYSRHCDSCEKSVVDFTQNSRAEIIAYMLSNRDNSVCGRMRADQFDFRHEDIPVLLQTLDRQKTANPFLILALVCMSLSAYGQQETQTVINTPSPKEYPVKMGKMIATPVEVEKTDTVKPVECTIIEQGEVMLGDISVEEPVIDEKDKIYKYTPNMPEFPGGIGKMTLFIDENRRYPAMATPKGTVYVRFVVEANGEITHTEILRSLHQNLDEEALRIINSMPNWVPGKKEGKKVPVYMTVPVRF